MSNATEYADSLAASITADTENGNPFGLSEGYGDIPEGEPLDALTWLEDALDIQYLISNAGEYIAGRVLIAFGGPTAWIDTRTGMLEVSWWSAVERRELPDSFIEALDDALEDVHESH